MIGEKHENSKNFLTRRKFCCIQYMVQVSKGYITYIRSVAVLQCSFTYYDHNESV